MRPYPDKARRALAPLVFLRLRAGDAPPLDWAAAAIDAGAVLEIRRRPLTRRRLAVLRRRGLLRDRAA